MQDVFIEYMVKKQTTLQTMLQKVGIVVASLVLFVLGMLLSGSVGMLSIFVIAAAIGALYGGYYLLMLQNIEFEYILTNGELDVDQIMGQRKRRRLLSVDCRNVTDFGRYDAAKLAQRQFQKTVMACDHPQNPELWYFVTGNGTLLVLSVNERLLAGIRPFLPRQIAATAFPRGGAQ